MKFWYGFSFILIFALILLGIYFSTQKTNQEFNTIVSSYTLNSPRIISDSLNNPSIEEVNFDSEFNGVKDVVISTNGRYGLFIKYYPNLHKSGDWSFDGTYDTSLSYYFNEGKLFYGASLFKTPIAIATLLELEEGNLSMGDTIVYLASDYSEGTGDINRGEFGSVYTIDEVLSKLLKKSDNTAQNILLRVLGWPAISDTFKAIGVSPDYFNKNFLSPEDGVLVFDTIIKSSILAKNSGAYILELLDSTDFDNRLDIGIDGEIDFSHKIGTDIGTYHDCGVASGVSGTAVVCLLSENTNQEEFELIAQKVGKFITVLVGH